MNNLKYGSTGALVEALQLALIRSGFLYDAPDGIFGKNTLEALKSFQRAFGIEASGKMDSLTLPYIEQFLQGFYTKKIKKGDSFWGIAAESGIRLKNLITANPNTDIYNLQIGQEICIPYNFEIVPTEISYSFFLTSSILKGLKARYPFIKSEIIGYSVMKKPLEAIIIGKGGNRLFINAGFHANEWLNIPLVLKFAEDYLQAYVMAGALGDVDSEYLFQNTTLIILPLVNPDGTDLVTGALSNGEQYESAESISSDYPALPFPQAWKANINGVDLNLQFPANWEKAREIKFAQGFTKPSPIEYVGSAPLTEPEAKAVFDYTKNNDFRLILAYHSQGSIIYWKYLDYLPPDSLRIGNLLSDASGYPLELTPADSSYAGFKDWFISEYNRPGYTIETGKGKNPLPISQFDMIYKSNKPLIITALKEVAEL